MEKGGPMKKIMILILILTSTLVSYGNSLEFTDVKEEQWHYKWVKTLVDLNITSGYPDNTFKPNTNNIDHRNKCLL